MIIALLGAESTGKSALAQTIAVAMQNQGTDAVAVGEYLRQWCAEHGRTPLQHEQAHIAATQHARIMEAAQRHAVVIADTTALMTAVYSDYVFGDRSLYAHALEQQRAMDVTLVSGLDIAWEADGIQRDGAHARPPVDALLRQTLDDAHIAYRVIYGLGDDRLHNAIKSISLNAINSVAAYAVNTWTTEHKYSEKWVWSCDKCSDPECEHQLFSQLLKPPSI
jgi:nicotinamide riboside kinase